MFYHIELKKNIVLTSYFALKMVKYALLNEKRFNGMMEIYQEIVANIN